MDKKLWDLRLVGGIFVIALVVSLATVAVYSMVVTRGEGAEVLGKEKKSGECATIQEGGLLTTDGREIGPGFDEWGYNYQARIFSGGYCDAYRDAAWCQPYKDVDLMMKWNDSWLSNKDCDGDEKLDRHFGFGGYVGSGAWLTNHQSGSYVGDDGKEHNWNYFVKIVAAPADAVKKGDTWYMAGGEEIGPVIWGDFAIIQQVSNDPYAGAHGIETLSPIGPGFGKFK